MIAAGLAALDRMVMPRLVLHGQEQPVPDISGLDFPAAADSLHARGFRAVIGGHEPHGEYPLGVIVGQEPPAGSLAKPSRTIRVILAAGPATIAVPVLSRMGCREAMAALSQAGLCVGDILMARAEWSSIGQVLATSPQEGESVLLGSEIDLLVAGPQQADCFIVPDFVGRLVGDVVQELRTSGIPLGLRTFVTGASAREGTVFSTDPPAGFRICKGESLSVVVAS
jgi:beta-lactam-binding protein with PASTA domain